MMAFSKFCSMLKSLQTMIIDTNLYGPLDTAREEIRLVHFLPTEGNGVIYEMDIVSLDENPHYVALSYTWGKPTPKVRLQISGHSKDVTPNLGAFFADFSTIVRQRKQPVSIWIDAICIDQENLLEKSTQIRLMERIYNQADKVIAWLGKNNKSNSTFNTMRVLADFTQKHHLHDVDLLNWPKDETEQMHVIQKLQSLSVGHESNHDIPLTSLSIFMTNDWWDRIWTFQEIALARDIDVFWGKEHINWICLWHLIPVLSLKMRASPEMREESRILNWMVSHLSETWTVCTSLNCRTRSPHKLCLLDALNSVIDNGRVCSDPKDHIVGLLGMVGNQSPNVQHLRDLPYTASVVDIYTSTAQLLIDTHGLRMLTYCFSDYSVDIAMDRDSENDRRPSSVVGLPSWVPDWTKDITSLQGSLWSWGKYGRSSLYGASEALDKCESYKFSTDHRLLHIEGVQVDEILHICPKLSIGDTDDLSHVRAFWPALYADLRSLLQSSPIYENESSKMNTILRTVVADRIKESDSDGPRRMNGTEDRLLLEYINDNILVGKDSGSSILTPKARMYLIMSSYEAKDRRVFVTSKGYMGLGRRSCKVGDIVCILHSSTVPFVLRRTTSEAIGNPNYRLIGEAYLHGIMDGEYVTLPSDIETFTLA